MICGLETPSSLVSAVATLPGGALKLSDAQPGLRATLAIPALTGVMDQKLSSPPPLEALQAK